MLIYADFSSEILFYVFNEPSATNYYNTYRKPLHLQGNAEKTGLRRR